MKQIRCPSSISSVGNKGKPECICLSLFSLCLGRELAAIKEQNAELMTEKVTLDATIARMSQTLEYLQEPVM